MHNRQRDRSLLAPPLQPLRLGNHPRMVRLSWLQLEVVDHGEVGVPTPVVLRLLQGVRHLRERQRPVVDEDAVEQVACSRADLFQHGLVAVLDLLLELFAVAAIRNAMQLLSDQFAWLIRREQQDVGVSVEQRGDYRVVQHLGFAVVRVAHNQEHFAAGQTPHGEVNLGEAEQEPALVVADVVDERVERRRGRFDVLVVGGALTVVG